MIKLDLSFPDDQLIKELARLSDSERYSALLDLRLRVNRENSNEFEVLTAAKSETPAPMDALFATCEQRCDERDARVMKLYMSIIERDIPMLYHPTLWMLSQLPLLTEYDITPVILYDLQKIKALLLPIQKREQKHQRGFGITDPATIYDFPLKTIDDLLEEYQLLQEERER